LYKYRYLIDFDLENMETEYHDVVIIGSGIAGLYTALEIDEKYDVAIFTKEAMDTSNSVLAQGGIAVSLDKDDSPELHFKDTLFAGAGLCNEESVWVLVKEAASNIEKLCRFGVNFDHKDSGELALGREAAHSKNRIIHAGDTTGKEVCDKLISIVSGKKNIKIREKSFVVDLITEDDSTKGVIFYDESSKKYKACLSNIVICATGGFGQLYANTTNPEVATGDGVCLAYRAGAQLVDLEFIQFHPTVLYHSQNKTFLISEAVRGEGAILRNINGKRFMPEYHELNELAPRDVVSRAIFAEMEKTSSKCVYLDITFKDREYLANRFPNIFKTCLEYGIDMSKDYIPVAPAEHYCMGGIKTDTYGRTNIKGFYACGESACTGIHGANRLASNSLLEGLVFGHRIADEVNNILSDSTKRQVKIKHLRYITDRKSRDIDLSAIAGDIKNTMTRNVGIIRNAEGLKAAREKMSGYGDALADLSNKSITECEVQNMLLLSMLIIESALEREESRGAHYRSDFPKTDDEKWKRNIIKERLHA